MTDASEVFDLFMQIVDDYRLIALFQTDESDFEAYLEAWLLFAIRDFKICDQDLTYSKTTKQFTVDLTQENIIVLATLMSLHWLTKTVQDITQMNIHVSDRDFKMPSEAQNLREKSAHLNTVKELCSQLLNDYAYARVDWTSWTNQSFMGV